MVIMTFIEDGDEYIPLVNITDGEYIFEEDWIFSSNVKLLHIGSKETNKLRLIAFRKAEQENLILDENLQISDFDITVRNNNILEGIKNSLTDALNILDSLLK